MQQTAVRLVQSLAATTKELQYHRNSITVDKKFAYI